MKLEKWQSQAVRLTGSAALLAGIFWFIPFSDVFQTLRGVKPGYALVGLLLMLTTAYLDALALWLPLNRVGVPGGHWAVFEIKMITRFYGQFLPSELMASAVKLHRLANPTKQWGEVAAGMVFSRIVSMLVLVFLGLTLWAIEMPSGSGRWAGYLLVAMAVGLMGLHLTARSITVSRFVEQLLRTRAFAWLQGRLLNKFLALGRKTGDCYRLFGNAIYPVMLFALARHVLGIFSFAAVALALDIHISLLTIGWIRVVLAALVMLPISVAGFGVREGSLIVMLQEYAVAPGDAVALAFLLFIVGLLCNGIGGLLEIRNLLAPRRAREQLTPGTD